MNRNARNRGRGGLLARAFGAIRGAVGGRRAASRSAGRSGNS